jgi:septal ring factor EnvC (AmiA/AmiB activator)
MNNGPQRYKYVKWGATLLLGLSLLCVPADGYAQKGKTKTRAQLESQRKAALKQIDATSAMLKKTDKSVKQQLGELELLNSEIKTRQALLAVMQRELEEMKREQDALQETINSLQSNINDKQQRYAAALRHMYRWNRSSDEVLFILSARDMAECVRRVRYLHSYSAWRKKQAEELGQEQERARAAKAELAERQAERESLLADQRREQAALEQKQGRQKQLVTELSGKKKQLQEELAQQQKQAQALDRMIQQKIEEETRRAAEEARRKAEAERKAREKAAKAAGSKNGKSTTPAAGSGNAGKNTAHVVNPSDNASTKLSGSFAQNKGRLPYPVNGSYAVVGHFGTQQHSQYVQTVNNGIILQTKSGAEACAIFDGEVNTIMQLPGYNISVIVRHGTYFSVYNNLSKVYVKQGQQIKMHDRIGLIYSDPENGNQTRMDFQIWNSNRKEDPEKWLRR